MSEYDEIFNYIDVKFLEISQRLLYIIEKQALILETLETKQ